MKPLKNLHNEQGQGLMEYTLIMFWSRWFSGAA